MLDRRWWFLLAVLIVGCVLAVYVAISRPAYFSSTTQIESILFIEILLAAIWNYRTRFFPILLAVFLGAGMALPWNDVWTSARWFVLAAGALVGLAIYTKDRQCRFSTIHLMAFFCVVAAFVSAMVSAYPQMAFLKALSLLFLFAYSCSGARLAASGRDTSFFSGLLLSCEGIVYLTAIAYFLLRKAIFGNPNSLGAVMGVAAVPVLLWGILITDQDAVRWRRAFAFALALLLLFGSYARAGIVAAAISCTLLCMALRRYKALMKGVAMALVLAALVASIGPLRAGSSQSVTSAYLYKGRPDLGILGSRKTVWDRTILTIEQHPWFGSGFGTSPTSDEVQNQFGKFASVPHTTREHGNSYLAITEWVGLLGGFPFFALVILIAGNVARVVLWMRRTGNAFSPAVPLATVLLAGLVHAAFEDWLFAVGYHLCVFFWAMAFVMVDVIPASVPPLAPQPARFPNPWGDRLGMVTHSQ